MIFKVLFDIVASGCGLLVLSQVLLVVAIWIKLDSPGPVFYRQVHVGYKNNDFRIFKFRSMSNCPKHELQRIMVLYNYQLLSYKSNS